MFLDIPLKWNKHEYFYGGFSQLFDSKKISQKQCPNTAIFMFITMFMHLHRLIFTSRWSILLRNALKTLWNNKIVVEFDTLKMCSTISSPCFYWLNYLGRHWKKVRLECRHNIYWSNTQNEWFDLWSTKCTTLFPQLPSFEMNQTNYKVTSINEYTVF